MSPLRRRMIEDMQIRNFDDGRTIFFRDPDGHLMEVRTRIRSLLEAAETPKQRPQRI